MAHSTKAGSDGILYAAALGCAGLFLVLRFGLRLAWPWAWLSSIALATFALYGLDKRGARRGKARVPESVLHLFALLGGTPGAFAGQQIWRHKTRKRSFQVLFWTIALLQASALLLWWTGRLA